MTEQAANSTQLDLRLVESFMALARHRHFGRAADAVHTTQPSLSRQIRRLEHQVGVRLVERSSRGAELTEAGSAFLPLASALLQRARHAVAQARAATQPARTTIGVTTNLIVTPAVRHLRQCHPDADVQVVHLPWDQPRAALVDHRVDAVVTRLPLTGPTPHEQETSDGLLVTVLHAEPRVLMVPVDHRLAGRQFVTFDDIADEPMPRVHDAEWNAFWRVDPRPDGRPAPDGPLIEQVEDKVELVASGQAVTIIPSGEHLGRLRPDLRTVPLQGAEPSHVVLVTRAGDPSPLVDALRSIAPRYLR
ncbi:DNA-binding transcriptional LysR family regulator [Motilibacter peucedani]|uniref:DNA-binding transcriptional LysR family regulator n=1 Tax=Motilibacter peucedani TaxID=598650 RepID=A0A420XSY7_9ACTN|nr:LysR family transcriptional regulator [Motilibacter peucedani]RKS79938.1 DNA-binding transcriptional LysR family regulator [Motilibacter peucedani]